MRGEQPGWGKGVPLPSTAPRKLLRSQMGQPSKRMEVGVAGLRCDSQPWGP